MTDPVQKMNGAEPVVAGAPADPIAAASSMFTSIPTIATLIILVLMLFFVIRFALKRYAQKQKEQTAGWEDFDAYRNRRASWLSDDYSLSSAYLDDDLYTVI